MSSWFVPDALLPWSSHIGVSPVHAPHAVHTRSSEPCKVKPLWQENVWFSPTLDHCGRGHISPLSSCIWAGHNISERKTWGEKAKKAKKRDRQKELTSYIACMWFSISYIVNLFQLNCFQQRLCPIVCQQEWHKLKADHPMMDRQRERENVFVCKVHKY